MEYREVLQGYLTGWSKEVQTELREQAIDLASHRFAEKLAPGDIGGFDAIEEESINLVDGEESRRLEMMLAGYRGNCDYRHEWADIEPAAIRSDVEDDYVEELVDSALEDYDGWDLQTSFNGDNVAIRVGGEIDFELLERFSGFEGTVGAKLTVRDIEPGNKYEMRNRVAEKSESPDELKLFPTLFFDGGKIRRCYQESHPLEIVAEDYTGEFEEVLSKFNL